MGFRGKFDPLRKFLSCKNDKKDNIPPPPPPPPPPPYLSGSQTQQPSFDHTSMQCLPGWGVSANHMPVAGGLGATPTTDGFNVFCIKGYSGHVKLPKDASPMEIFGGLETMNQVMNNQHNYDPTKFAAMPCSPTPSDDDKKREIEAKKVYSFTVGSSTPNLACKMCHLSEKDKVKEIKRIDNIPLCYPCVKNNFDAEAPLAWNGH